MTRHLKPSAIPSRRSAIASSMTPPSGVRQPPSKSAVIFLRPTAGKENGRIVVSVIGGVAGAQCASVGFNPILRLISVLRHV